MREVFLSQAGRDQVRARKIRDYLVAHGVPVWFSPRHIRGAQQWQDEIGQALKRRGWFLIVLTPHSVRSMWVRRELNYALIEKRYQDRIIPALLKDCDVSKLSWILPQLQLIDFRRDFTRGCEELLRVWEKRRRT